MLVEVKKKSSKDLCFDIELKALSSDGSFEAYASVFNNIDRDNEIVAPGAFKKTLREHRKAGTMPALLWQHQHDEVIGVIEEAKEDQIGLKIIARLNLETQKGKEAYSLLKQSALKTLSFGFRRIAWEVDEKKGTRTLTELELWEASLVTFPSNPKAQITALKSRLEDGEIPTVREFENFLTAEGFSRKQAIEIINNGYKSFGVMRDAGDDEAMKDVSNALDSLKKSLSK